MIEILHVDKLPDLPEGSLGLNPQGWQVEVFEQVTVRLTGYTLEQAMRFIGEQHGSLLGAGTLRFYVFRTDPITGSVTGCIVFVPEGPHEVP